MYGGGFVTEGKSSRNESGQQVSWFERNDGDGEREVGRGRWEMSDGWEGRCGKLSKRSLTSRVRKNSRAVDDEEGSGIRGITSRRGG